MKKQANKKMKNETMQEYEGHTSNAIK